MSQPTPFEVGRGIGENVSKGFQGYQDTNAIDQILGQAYQSQDPNAVPNAMQAIMSRVSPEKQQQAMQILQSKHQQMVNQKTQNEMTKVADTIEANNPDSASHKVTASILRSDMPTDQKEKLIKVINDTNPFKIEQNRRLKYDSDLRRYNTRIKELDLQIKNTTRRAGKDKLQKQRESLSKERDLLLDYEALREKEEPKKSASEKVKFDASNPEHMKRFEEIEVESKGDRVKINEAMGEEFNL